MAGGGPFSARMTAPLCIAGGIASQVLDRQGIQIGAHIQQIGNIKDIALNPCNPDMAKLRQIQSEPLAVISDEARAKMAETILSASEAGDSVGGIVEACALHVPAGIGGAMYEGLESALAPILFAIPAVKGVEFGAGFEAASLKGSENNDPFYFDGDEIKTKTNNHGGILGGITSGMPLIVSLAFKPTPSISKPQQTVSLSRMEATELQIKGRHDPCIVPRAIPVIEAAAAIAIYDAFLISGK
jgi:chorismate synthase